MSFFCLHHFALSTNPRTTPAEISRYRLIPMSVLLISRQPMKLQISFGFARAMPTTNPRTGMLWERDWLHIIRYQHTGRTSGCQIKIINITIDCHSRKRRDACPDSEIMNGGLSHVNSLQQHFRQFNVYF